MLFSRTELSSGVRVLTEVMPEVRSATLGFWIGVGSRDEGDRFEGASHLLEHLLFKGTETRGAREIAEAFDAVGGGANAFASKEYSCVYARVLDRDLPTALGILADMIRNPSLRGEDLESERRVVLEEIAMLHDTPDDLVHELLAEIIFGDHPLGREVMGSQEAVRSITRQDVADFHGSSYGPRRLVVAVAGNIDHQEVSALVEEVFAGGQELPAVERQPLAPARGERLRVLQKSTEQAHIVLGGLGYPKDHDDRFAWGVLDTLLGGGMSSRIFQEIREARGLAYSVYSYRNLFSDAGCWGLYAGTTPGSAQEVVKLMHDELDRLLDDGVTGEELERAKGHTRGAVVLGLEDPPSRMTRLGKSEITGSEILSIDELIARVDAVTVEDLARVSRDLFPADNRCLAVIGPFDASDFP